MQGNRQTRSYRKLSTLSDPKGVADDGVLCTELALLPPATAAGNKKDLRHTHTHTLRFVDQCRHSRPPLLFSFADPEKCSRHQRLQPSLTIGFDADHRFTLHADNRNASRNGFHTVSIAQHLVIGDVFGQSQHCDSLDVESCGRPDNPQRQALSSLVVLRSCSLSRRTRFVLAWCRIFEQTGIRSCLIVEPVETVGGPRPQRSAYGPNVAAVLPLGGPAFLPLGGTAVVQFGGTAVLPFGGTAVLPFGSAAV